MHEVMQDTRVTISRLVGRLAGVCLLLVMTACGGGHELERYSFAGATIAAADFAPPAPALWTGSYELEGDDAITAVVNAGASVAKEVEARRARVRLDSASKAVDVRERMTRRTLERAARYLGATPLAMADHGGTTNPDYLLEVYVRQYGIDARGSRPARVFMKVEAVLLDRRSGHEVWNVEVDSHDRLTPSVRHGNELPADIVTAGTLHTVTVEQLESALADLIDFTADYVTNELREDLRDVRRG